MTSGNLNLAIAYHNYFIPLVKKVAFNKGFNYNDLSFKLLWSSVGFITSTNSAPGETIIPYYELEAAYYHTLHSKRKETQVGLEEFDNWFFNKEKCLQKIAQEIITTLVGENCTLIMYEILNDDGMFIKYKNKHNKICMVSEGF